MKNTKYSFTGNPNHQQRSAPQTTPGAQESKWGPKPAVPPGIRTTARDYANPVDYKHPYPSMAQFADLLALHYDANRTRHAYYRQLRLLHQHFSCDPSTITEAQLREYFLFVNAALLKIISIRGWTSLCAASSIDCVALKSQLSAPSGYPFGDDHSTSKSKAHHQPGSIPRFGRIKDTLFFPPTPHSPNASAIGELFN